MITQEEILTAEIRALNIKHPYAELMKPPYLKQETRTWATQYRGLVLICSSANPYADKEILDISGPEQTARIIQFLGPKWFNAVKRGSAIAIGRLTGCYHSTGWKTRQKDFEENTFVAWKAGLYVHTYEDVTPIKTFPWRGQVGWQTVTDEQKQLIKLL